MTLATINCNGGGVGDSIWFRVGNNNRSANNGYRCGNRSWNGNQPPFGSGRVLGNGSTSSSFLYPGNQKDSVQSPITQGKILL